MSYDYYKMIRNHVQLGDVELFELICKKNHETNGNFNLKVNIQRDAKIIVPKQAEIYMTVKLEFEGQGPFTINVVYKGKCFSSSEISDEELHEYAYEQVVPLLLPYLRECISNILARMQLPIYYLPTMDILQSLAENRTDLNQE